MISWLNGSRGVGKMTTGDQSATRTALIARLVTEPRLAADLSPRLSAFGWDSDELVTLTRSHIVDVLTAYAAGDLLASEVEQWANAVESRDDVGFDHDHEDAVREAIFQLANPLLEGRLTRASARDLAAKLAA